MTGRCQLCCQLYKDCKCPIQKGRYTCFRCTGLFEVGDQYRSDAPGVIYHLGCYLAERKEAGGNS